MSDERLEELLADRLAAFQEQLDSGSTCSPPSSCDSEFPPELAREFEERKRLLRLLHSLRHPAEPRLGHGAQESPPRATARFERLNELGSGGFGIVWRARDPMTGRIVALKVPRPEVLASPELRKRFEQEAEAAARLDHSNIVSILEAGTDGLVPYIASAYYEGPTLAQWLSDRVNPVPPRLAAHVALSLAKALAHAHERGVLHRDVKPSNVLLAAAPEGTGRELPFEPKLMDFGLAKLGERDQDLTRTGAMLGTLKYMAPEQAAGRAKEITAATDVYGLGVVLYELLAGTPPFEGESDWLTLRQVLEDEPRSLSAVRRDVPRDLAVIVQKCLSKVPTQRYRSARELVEDLERFLDGRTIVARPVPLAERLAKWCRRNPAWAALAGVMVAGLVSGIAFLSYSNVRISRALAAEHASREQLATRLYAADIRRADEALRRHNVQHAREILASYAVPDRDVDRREFAWRFLWSRLPQQRPFTPEHPAAVYSIDLAPAENLLATACADGRVRVWTAAGTPVVELSCEGAEPNEIAFSPDGKWLAAACDNGLVRVWQTADWEPGRTFEIGGVVTTDLGHNHDEIRDLALQDNGAIVVAAVRQAEDSDAVLARYQASGLLDRSFHGAGTVPLWPSAQHEVASAVLIDPDGKIVVAGNRRFRNFTVSRINPDGSEDRTFGQDASVVTNIGSNAAIPYALLRQPDGKYLVAGKASPVSFFDSALIRLLANGTLDPEFGTGGVVLTEVGKFDDTIGALALQADGKILAAGRVALNQKAPTQSESVLLRYNPDGTLDTTFAQGGILILHLSDKDDGATKVVVQPDGKILLAGYAEFDEGFRAVVLRLNDDGTRDTSFAVAGLAKLESGEHRTVARALGLLADGRIVVGGVIRSNRDRAMYLVRLQPNGSTDETFGEAGHVSLHLGNRTELHAMQLQPDGRIVVAGFAWCGGSESSCADFVLARLLPDGSLDRTLSSNGAQGVRFTPDSKQVVSYSEQNVRFWDLASGRLARQAWASWGAVKSIDLSEDGSRLGTACENGFELWNTDKLAAPVTRTAIPSSLASLALLPRPDALVLGFARGDISLYCAAKEPHLTSLELNKVRRPRLLRMSPDRHWLTTVSDNTASVYQADSLTRVAELVAPGRLFDARIGPQAKSILTSSVDGNVMQWPLGATQAVGLGEAGRTLYHTPDRITACQLAPDEKSIACGHASGLICLADTTTGKILFEFPGQGSAVSGLGFLPTGRLVVGYASGSVAVLDIASRTLREAYSVGHPIQRLIMSADSRRIALSVDGTNAVEILDTTRFERLSRIQLRGHAARMSFTPRGDRLAVVGGGHLEVFDTTTGSLLASETQLGNTYEDVQIFARGTRLAVAERSHGVTVRNLSDGRVLHRMLPEEGGASCIAVSPDGRNLVSSDTDGLLRIWDTETYQALLKLDNNLNRDEARAMFFSADGRTLYTHGDESVVVWETRVATPDASRP